MRRSEYHSYKPYYSPPELSRLLDSFKELGISVEKLEYTTERNFIVQADYSQIENRIAALLCGDEQIAKWYEEGLDVHRVTASKVFKVLYELVTDEQRQVSKIVRYGANYGGTAKTIHEQISKTFPSIPLHFVEDFLDDYYKLHPEQKAFNQSQLRKAKRNGYIEGPLSKRRHYFYGAVEPAKVYNLPIQDSAAWIINQAVIAIVDAMEINTDEGVNVYGESLNDQVHDSLAVEGPDPFRLFSFLKTHMEREVELNGITIKFPIDIEVGANWEHGGKVKSENDVAVEVLRLATEHDWIKIHSFDIIANNELRSFSAC